MIEKDDRYDKRPEVVDLIMFDGNNHRVLDLPINDGMPVQHEHMRVIDIKKGEIIDVDKHKISMRMAISRYDHTVNAHPSARSLIRMHFGL
jgi:hypothetical protein